MTEETPTPKRRGRPPGSKNKPKDPSAPKPVRSPKPTPVATLAIHPDATPEEAEQIKTTLTPLLAPALMSTAVTVVLQFGAALGKETDDREVQWPSDWPIPNVNDAVMAGPKLGGRVISRNFRFHEGKIYLLLN